jgi:hypothetical protein
LFTDGHKSMTSGDLESRSRSTIYKLDLYLCGDIIRKPKCGRTDDIIMTIPRRPKKFGRGVIKTATVKYDYVHAIYDIQWNLTVTSLRRSP